MKVKKYVVPTIKARNIQSHNILAGSPTGEIDPWLSKQYNNLHDEWEEIEDEN